MSPRAPLSSLLSALRFRRGPASACHPLCRTVRTRVSLPSAQLELELRHSPSRRLTRKQQQQVVCQPSLSLGGRRRAARGEDETRLPLVAPRCCNSFNLNLHAHSIFSLLPFGGERAVAQEGGEATSCNGAAQLPSGSKVSATKATSQLTGAHKSLKSPLIRRANNSAAAGG